MASVVKTKEARYPNLLPYIVFVAFLNALLVAFCFFSAWQHSHYRRDFTVDADMFQHSVSNAVTSFLDSFVQSELESSGSPSPANQPAIEKLSPRVVHVESLGFATSPRHGRYFVLANCVYREGDFCDYGLVVSVGDDRAICNGDDGLLILRPVYPDVKNDWYGDRAGGYGGGRTPAPEGMQKPASGTAADTSARLSDHHAPL